MELKEAREKLNARLTCETLEFYSALGQGCDKTCDECAFNYAQGNMKERRDVLNMALQSMNKIEQLEIDMTGYESPINIVQSVQKDIAENVDKQIYTAIQQVGVIVNKDELIKALSYDRNQYEEGYKNGYMKAKEDLKTALTDVSLTDMQRNVISAILENLF